jgi:hypothetical protein
MAAQITAASSSSIGGKFATAVKLAIRQSVITHSPGSVLSTDKIEILKAVATKDTLSNLVTNLTLSFTLVPDRRHWQGLPPQAASSALSDELAQAASEQLATTMHRALNAEEKAEGIADAVVVTSLSTTIGGAGEQTSGVVMGKVFIPLDKNTVYWKSFPTAVLVAVNGSTVDTKGKRFVDDVKAAVAAALNEVLGISNQYAASDVLPRTATARWNANGKKVEGETVGMLILTKPAGDETSAAQVVTQGFNHPDFATIVTAKYAALTAEDKAKVKSSASASSHGSGGDQGGSGDDFSDPVAGSKLEVVLDSNLDIPEKLDEQLAQALEAAKEARRPAAA